MAKFSHLHEQIQFTIAFASKVGISISICNRMRPSRIKDKFSRVFSKFSQNCPSPAATRAICENFENTSEIYP